MDLANATLLVGLAVKISRSDGKRRYKIESEVSI